MEQGPALPRISVGVIPRDAELCGARRELKDWSAQGPTAGGDSEARWLHWPTSRGPAERGLAVWNRLCQAINHAFGL